MLDKENGLWLFTVLLVTSSAVWHTAYCEDETVSTLRGQSVVLTCPIDITSCGDLHSVKWFKGNERVAVVSGDGDVSNVEGQFTGRMTISHNPKGPLTKLNLKSVQVTDEDKYLCETTFIEPMESCDNTGSYSILLKVNVPPSSIQIVDESNNPIKNATTLGPLREGHRFSTICEVRATRPVPLVGWYRAGKRLTDSVTTSELNGLYSVKSVLSLELSRQELGANIECRVETPALENIVSNNIHIDLQVRPTKVDLSGVKDHTVQGSNILLQCLVVGARPAANVTWYNNTERLDPDENQDKRTITTRTDFKNDGTFETLSQLIFAATRFENGVQIRCEADNVVMRDDLDKPLHDTLSLEVMYPPVVNVKPENITVNETGEFLLFCEYEANPASLKSVRWLRNGEPVDVNQGRIEGGNTEQTALLIKEASRDDIGSYTCELKNDYGIGVSENDIDVDVYYVPIVELTKEPTKPIIEKDESNVTLYCNVVKGNPSTLLKVRWFLDGQMLKELPECQEGTGDDDDSLCGVNPNVLLLENVGREFLGNYSCEGLNAAGWGQRSKENELMIYYQPGNATLIHHPLIATKKKSVTFQCSVEDGGNPNATRYRWLRGGSPVMDIVTSVWTVDPVGLDSRTNFSCYAYNEGGDGNPATIDLDVHVPQAFIQKLHPYTGALYNIPGIMLTCRVECVPECTINWFKDGVGIDESNDRYYINETYLRAEPATGDFESVLSELHFNMSAWPDQKLDIYKDNANYSCSSTSKTDGPGVRSATYIGVEYPPENTTITNSTINVEEGLQPPRVSCSAKAYPEPYYEWRRKDVTIAKGSVLYIFRNMTKEDDGDYHCISFNKHGNHSAVTRMNVLYKPNCTIDRKEINDEDTLVCTAIGNPTEMDFEWSVKSDNETTGLQEVRNSDSGGSPASFLILNNDFTVQRTYRCVANNSVGVGTFCEIEVAGHLMWWQRLDKVTLYILLGLVAALLLTVIIVCIIIICICRKRRRQDKYHTDLSISATQSVLSVPTTPPPRPPPPEIPKSPPKWPLRPGVMVHVKSDTKLSASRTQSPASIAANNSSNQHNVSYASPILSQSLRSTSQPPVANVSSNREVAIDLSPKSPPILPSRNLLNKFQTKTTVPDNGTETRECSADGIADHNGSTAANNTNDELINFTSSSLIERILGRLRWRRERTKRNDVDGETDDGMTKGNKRAVNLIRGATGWFGSGKSTNSSTGLFDKRHQFSGITCSDGVVTYKRTPVAVRPIVSEDANTNNNNSNESRKRKVNANVNDKSSAAGDPLTDPGEYENLPFHGMQSAPNKPLSADDLDDDMEYADVDYRSYGPINYKAASIYALVKKNKNGNLQPHRK
ncbi:hemicentin-2 isoform X5 [Bradysia coprophila]|uniref:hemicentin-2 isoform X5 n=1 Tax=Bradysia coprophila TaxID=38358 RepID=UPI00187DCF55|nr:hemicentin-2 isoform X5 [Bradysia coprophila]